MSRRDIDIEVARRDGGSTVWRARVAAIASELTALAHQHQSALGSSRLVCIDGRAGAGKTTLGAALREAGSTCGSVRLLHMDDMYEGWNGLGEVSARIGRELVEPLRNDEAGRYQRYDWHLGRFAEWHSVEPVDLLVLEGVGSGARSYAGSVTALVWVEATRELRVARGIERDGRAVLPRWLAWMDDEDVLFEREDTRARADVVVDGTGTDPEAMVFP